MGNPRFYNVFNHSADARLPPSVGMASIDASAHRNGSAEQTQQLSHLFESAAQRIFRARGIFNQNRQPAVGKLESAARFSNVSGCARQSFFAARSPKRSRMQDHIVRAQRQSPLQFASECLNRFFQEWRVRPCQINQVVRMNHQWLEIVCLPQPVQHLALTLAKNIRAPLPRTRREELKRIAAKSIGTLSGILHASHE